jgi:paraquat-inducible protein A
LANISLMACPECDLMHRIRALPKAETAVCSRCGAILRQGVHGSLDIPLALSLTSLVLFGFANASPLLVLQLHGSFQEATIPGCIRALVSLGWPWLAAILITTVVLAPPVYLGGLAYVLFQARRRRTGPWTARIFRVVQEFQAWAMTEVFTLGILVAYVKLADMAIVAPGFSVYALVAFIFATSAVMSSLDPSAVWDALGDKP